MPGDTLGELLGNLEFLLQRDLKSIDACQGGGSPSGLLRFAFHGPSQRPEESVANIATFPRQLMEQTPGNLVAHPGQMLRGGLMFVIVAGAAVDLADVGGFHRAEHVAEHANFQGPSRVDGQISREGQLERTFAGEGVAEGEEEMEEGMVPGDSQQGVETGRQKQATHPAIEAVGDSAVVHFCEAESKLGIRHREAQPRESRSVEGEDIAILEGQ